MFTKRQEAWIQYARRLAALSNPLRPLKCNQKHTSSELGYRRTLLQPANNCLAYCTSVPARRLYQMLGGVTGTLMIAKYAQVQVGIETILLVKLGSFSKATIPARANFGDYCTSPH